MSLAKGQIQLNSLQPTFKIYKTFIQLNGTNVYYSSEHVLAGDAVGKGRWVFMEQHEADSASSSSVSAFFI